MKIQITSNDISQDQAVLNMQKNIKIISNRFLRFSSSRLIPRQYRRGYIGFRGDYCLNGVILDFSKSAQSSASNEAIRIFKQKSEEFIKECDGNPELFDIEVI